MVIPPILYFSFNYFMAFLKYTLLFVTILTRLSHLQMIFSKSHCYITLKLFYLSALASIHKNSSHLSYATYLQPFDTGLIYTNIYYICM